MLGLGVAGLTAGPLPAWLVGTDEYRTDSLGFRFLKPPHWRFAAAADIDARRAEATLPGGESGKAAVIEKAGLALLAATRFAPPKRGPTLVIWRSEAGPRDPAPDDSERIARIHHLSYGSYAPQLRGFRMIEDGHPVIFAGRPASRVVVEFGEDNARGESWVVRMESHGVRWGNSWLAFNAADFVEGWGREAREDFAAIEKSLEFFPPAT